MGWFLNQSQKVLLDLPAFLSALTVNAVQTKQRGQGTQAGQLAQALSLDMRLWWTPAVGGFYGRLPKAALI